MELSFLRLPFALLLLGLPWVWIWRRRAGAIVLPLLRTAIFLAVIIALMQPVLIFDSGTRYHVLIVDQSESLTAEAKALAWQQAQDLKAKAEPEDTIHLIQLGGAPQPEQGGGYQLLNYADSPSSLSMALQLALQSIPSGAEASVTLFSDGLSTDRHWAQVLEQLKVRQIPVHTYQLPLTRQDIYPAALTVLPARVGENVQLYIDVIGYGKNLQLQVASQNRQLGSSALFDSDGRSRVKIEFKVNEAGFLPLHVKLLADKKTDQNQTNNLITGVAAIQPPLQILYLGGQGKTAAEKLQTLLGAGIQIVHAAPDQLPANFSRFPLVMVDDLAVQQWPLQAQQQLLQAIEQQGTGLLYTGGKAAFGPGGYASSPLAKALPVLLQQKDEKSDPSIGLAIIIDTSASMAGNRIELARQMARIAIRRLQPHDRVGIVEFYGSKHWAVPMQPAANKIEIDRAIGRMKAIGGTVLYPALQEAYYGLKNVNTRYKHILLLTDAGVEDSNYEALLRRIAKDNINVSTVLVGQGGHNQSMSDMANWGKGRFYSIANDYQLIEMILKQPSTKKMPAYKEGRFELEARSARGWWGESSQQQLPLLSSYVQAPAKPQAEVILAIKGTGQPVLASWQYGLGRVTSLATEPVGTGTELWLDWQDYGAWLGRIATKTANQQQPFRIQIQRHFNKVTIWAESLVQSAEMQPMLRLAGEGQTTEALALVEQAPGLFSTELNYPQSKDLLLQLDTEQGPQFYADAAFSDRSVELQVDPATALDLTQLALQTQGLQLDQLESSQWQLSTSPKRIDFSALTVWPYLLFFALCCYLTELLFRRWPGNRSKV